MFATGKCRDGANRDFRCLRERMASTGTNHTRSLHDARVDQGFWHQLVASVDGRDLQRELFHHLEASRSPDSQPLPDDSQGSPSCPLPQEESLKRHCTLSDSAESRAEATG